MIAGAAALLLFIVMFFNWFGVDQEGAADISLDNLQSLADKVGAGFQGDRVDFNAWESFAFIDIILLITIIVAVGLAVMTASAQSVNLPVAASALTAGLGILATVLVLFRIIFTPYDLGRDFWVFVGLILAAGIAYGGWASMQEEGTSFQAQADRLQSRDTGAGGTGTGTTGGTPPPPPPRDSGSAPPPPST